MVPRGRIGGSGFLDQNVLVEDVRRLRLHQFGSHLRRRGVEEETPVLRNPIPVAVVAEEIPVVPSRRVIFAELSGFGHVAVHTLAQRVNPLREHPAQDNRPLLLKFLNVGF